MLTEKEKKELEALRSLSDEELVALSQEDRAYLKQLEDKSLVEESKPVDRSIIKGTVGLSRMGEEEARARTSSWKEDAMSTLGNLYKGNFEQFKANVQAVRAGTKKRPTKMNAEQEQMYGIVSNLLDAKDETDLVSRMDNLKRTGNKYAPIVERMGLRKSWQKSYNPASKTVNDPGTVESVGYALFPNTSLRNKDVEASLFDKGVGAVQDVFSLPSRAMTGTIEQFSPIGRDVSWSESIGRPDPYSNAGERFVDFTVSAPIPGGLVEKGALGTAKLVSKAPVVEKIIEKGSKAPILRNILPETAETAVLSPYLGKAQKTIGVGEDIATQSLKGAGQGTAYGIQPSIFLATNPEEASPYAREEGAASMIMAPLFGGALGALGGAAKAGGRRLVGEDKLTKFGDELTGGYKSYERMQEATKKVPLSDSREGVSQVARINDALDEALRRNAESRDIAARSSKPTPGGVETNLGDIPEDISLFPGQAEEYSKLIDNISKKYFTKKDKTYEPTMSQLVKARSDLGRMERKASDPNKKYMLSQAKGKIIEYMDELGGKSSVELTGEGPQVMSTMDELISKYPEAMVDVNGLKIPVGTFKDPHLYGLLERGASNKNVTVGADIPTSKLLDPKYSEMARIYSIKDRFLGEEGAEGALRKAAQARLSPINRGSEVQEAVNSMRDLVTILNRNKIAGPNGGEWSISDVDYLTPAVAREVRSKMRGSDGATFSQLLANITEGASLFSPAAMLYKATKPTAKGMKVVSGLAPTTARGDEGLPYFMRNAEQSEELPLFQDSTKTK